MVVLLIRYEHEIGSTKERLSIQKFDNEKDAIVAFVSHVSEMTTIGEIYPDVAEKLLNNMTLEHHAWYANLEYEIRTV